MTTKHIVGHTDVASGEAGAYRNEYDSENEEDILALYDPGTDDHNQQQRRVNERLDSTRPQNAVAEQRNHRLPGLSSYAA